MKGCYQNAVNLISWCQSRFNILSLKSNKFALKHEILHYWSGVSIKYWNFFKEHVLDNFTKFFFGTQVNELVNKYLDAGLSGLCNLLFSAV